MLDLRKYALALETIEPGDVVIDAGAFAGLFSFHYSYMVGPKGIVFSYEPQPSALEMFSKEAARRGSKNIRIYGRAASSVSGQIIPMKVYAESAEQCCTLETHLMDDKRMPGNTAMIEVRTQALDDLMNEIGSRRLSFIKIDTEGHEGKVIAGAERLLSKHSPIVVMEYGYVPQRIETKTIEQIGKIGYVCFDLMNMHRVEPGYVCIEGTDLVALPANKLNSYRKLLNDLISMPPLFRLKVFAHKVKRKLFS